MSIACLITQDLKEAHTLFNNSKMGLEKDNYTNINQWFVITKKQSKKSNLWYDLVRKWPIYDIMMYDNSENIVKSSDKLFFLENGTLTIFQKIT